MKSFFSIVFMTIVISGYSQKKELGEVSIDELKETKYLKDTSATAVVLFERGRTFFEFRQEDGFRSVTEVDVKIKIYKKEGYDYANKVIPFYITGSKSESVSFSKAVTYNLVNGVVEKSKLKSEGEFTEEKNKYWKLKKITMPNVKEGSIVEFRYTIRSPFLSTLPEWNFQKEIPVAYSEYTTNIPEYFFYKIYSKGVVKFTENKNRSNKSITLTHRSIMPSGFGKGSGSGITKEQVNYVDNVVTYSALDIPAMFDESYVNNINNYTSSIQHELTGVQMPNSPLETYASDWDSVTRRIYENDDFGSQLKKSSYFEDDLKSFLNDSNTKTDKMNAVFSFVKSRMTWNKMHSYTCEDGINKAYNNKTGNSAEINLMLTAMLRHVGLDANPVILSTRSNGIALYPSLSAFNYVVAAVEVENEIIFLDATSKYSQPNVLPIRDLNWFGRIIRNDGSSALVDLSPKMVSKDHLVLMCSIDKEGEISGKVRETYTDYEALNFRDANANLSQENYLEKLEKKYNDIQIQDYIIENKTEQANKQVVEQYNFKSKNSVEIIGDKIYFNPLFFMTKSVNPFKQDNREYPIDFVFQNQEKAMIFIDIPEGYNVESFPEPMNIVFSDNLLSFKFNISVSGNKIQVTSLFDTKTNIIAPDDYKGLKEFFNEMIKKQTERIVLKRV